MLRGVTLTRDARKRIFKKMTIYSSYSCIQLSSRSTALRRVTRVNENTMVFPSIRNWIRIHKYKELHLEGVSTWLHVRAVTPRLRHVLHDPAASCNAVSPSLFFASTSAPCPSSRRKTSSAPLDEATCNGVEPLRFYSLISAPRWSSNRRAEPFPK